MSLIDSQNMDEEKSDEEARRKSWMGHPEQRYRWTSFPKVLQKSLTDNNTAEVYKEFAVDTFGRLCVWSIWQG